MNPVEYISREKPISYNNKDKVGKYKDRLSHQFKLRYKKEYPSIPVEEDVATNIVYLHKNRDGVLDVDNMSKPFVDAFTGIIYDDDSQVRHRECSEVRYDEIENIEISFAGMNRKAAKELNDALDNEKDLVYFRVEPFDYSMITIGVLKNED